VKRCLTNAASVCGWRWLRDVTRQSFEKWISGAMATGKSAATVNKCVACVVTFGNWCVDSSRLTSNPFARIRKLNEKADPRRKRRALTAEELTKLLQVTRWRPLAEHGREVVTLVQPVDQPKKRSSWTRAELSLEGLPEAVGRARKALDKNPDLIDELDRLGQERALIVKTLVLTGLRQGELASLTVGQLVLNGPVPFLDLHAADEKNRQGSAIPLRSDLAGELAAWASGRESSGKLFEVPQKFVKILDRDFKAAGIPKRDERGRTVDVHALRHTFGTMLSAGGVAPRTAQAAMRHSSIELTMSTYTDPKFLDVQGAVELLPDLDLGTPLATLLAPASVQTGPQQSIPVILSMTANVSGNFPKAGKNQAKNRDSQHLRTTALSGRYRDRTCDPFRVKEVR
jgi:integrase